MGATLVAAFGMGAMLFGQTRPPVREASIRPYDFLCHGPYRAEVPRPERLLGYAPGTSVTLYGSTERVLETVASTSDRVRIFSLGHTPEHRDMHLVAISSAANLARLDAVRADLLRLSDPRKPGSTQELERLLARTPVVVWLSYNIHGDETAGLEAAMEVVYQLAASENPSVTEALDRCIVLVNPCKNPDGHDRFATFYNAHGEGRPEPFAYEHRQPWAVSGRFNHNLFDLNRDMIAASQPETRAAMQALLEWCPQVLADHHGETSNYFFPPVAMPVNPNVPRESYEAWLEKFGRGNAAAFDQHGWMYYVRDIFDGFYPGYWDSWPTLQGAIGMTYETDGGGDLGLRWRRDDETIVTFREAIARHVEASLATVMTAAANREALLRSQRAFFASAIEEGRTGKTRAYIISGANDPARLGTLVDVLLRNGIEVSRSEKPVRLARARNLRGGTEQDATAPAGSFMIDLAQPRSRILRALFETDVPQDEAFVRAQEDRRKRNDERGDEAPQEDYEFYDVTAWSLPLAFDLETWATSQLPDVEPQQVATVDGMTVTLSDASSAAAVRSLVGDAPVARATSAYVFGPERDGALRLAITLLQEGYRVSVSTRVLRAAGQDFEPGAFVVRVERNSADLHDRVTALADRFGVAVHAVNTAFADRGATGVGSESVVALRAPRLAVLAGDPTAPSSYGAVRRVLGQDFGFEFVPVGVDQTDAQDLASFDVLLLPDGDVDRYARMLGEGANSTLAGWVKQGGTLIAVGGAAAWAATPEADLVSVRAVGQDADEESDEAGEVAASGEETGRKSLAEDEPLFVPGAIMRASLARNHYLGFGQTRGEMPVLTLGDTFFRRTEKGTNVLAFGEKDLRLSGFVWPENTDRLLAGTACLIDEPRDRGNVILFAFEPGFRGYWPSSSRLLANAVLFAPTLKDVPIGR